MRTALATLTMCLLALPVHAKYSGGTGEPNDPYQIATAEDLIALGETPDDYDKHFILTADIDLDPNLPGRKVFDKAVIAPDTDPAPNHYGYNAYDGTAFTGVLDGDGHTISHLTITGVGFLGLFGQLGSEAEVVGLGMLEIAMTGSDRHVGGLAAENYGHVTNCYSAGSVSGRQNVGGLVAGNGGNVIHCYSTSAVSCADSIAGGLVGSNWGAVSTCYSKGSVIGTKWGVGGLAGHNEGTVANCYSSATVRGDGSVGGLVGGNDYSGSITASYSIGMVGGVGSSVGGLAGYNWGAVIRCFWDSQASGQTSSAGGTGKTTAQMQMADTFLDAGWDFVGETRNGTHEVWQMPERGDYLVFAVFNGYTPPRLQGAGTRENPYLVSDASELGAMTHHSPNAHYRLGASIDLSGVCWGTPVIPWFAGTFDGNDQTIVNLKINGGTDLGLFGRLESGAEVRDLGVVDVNIISSHGSVGGLAGATSGSVTRCYCTGAVRGTGSDSAGGLAGDNHGTMTQSYAHVEVTGPGWVGGLVGWNAFGVVTDCYSTGAVSNTVGGDSAVGGLVGMNGVEGATRSVPGTISHCYSTGRIWGISSVGGLVGKHGGGSVASSFWDVETSGQIGSDGGDGKTTAEMQTAATFLGAGWDFVGETANGTEDIWWILEGHDYPRLWWELPGIDDR